jgi:hypothetical protein
MTLAEYKANPEEWSPTFTVETAADFTAWRGNTAGNDYERVLVAASLTITTDGVNLTTTGTKQVVFADGVHLTFNSSSSVVCFYYSSLPTEDEYWMSKASVGGTFTTGSIYIFLRCRNMDSPVITGIETSTGSTVTVYGYAYCFNVYAPKIKDNTIYAFYGFVDGENVYDAVIEGSHEFSQALSLFRGFHYTKNIYNAVVKGTIVSNGVLIFEQTVNVHDPVISASITRYHGPYYPAGGDVGIPTQLFKSCTDLYNPVFDGNIEGGFHSQRNWEEHPRIAPIYGFVDCYRVYNPKILGTMKTAYLTNFEGGKIYGFMNCVKVINPVIDGSLFASDSSTEAGAVYGFYRCSTVVNPKAVLDNYAGTSYMHYFWEGFIENALGSSARTMFYPDYGTAGLVADTVLIPGRGVTLKWRVISPHGALLPGKTVYLYAAKHATSPSAYYELIYEGTASAVGYGIPSDATIEGFQIRLSSTSDDSCRTYLFGEDVAVTPIISGRDEDLGVFSDTFTPYEFSVSKNVEDTSDWTAAEVQAYLDTKEIQRFNLEVGVVKSLSLSRKDWIRALNGSHRLRLYAKRIISGVPEAPFDIRILTFEKQKNNALVSLSNPAVSEGMPKQIELAINGAFPDGSTLTVQTCNNGYDESPAWEDMTGDFEAGQPHQFTNVEKTADSWGVNIKLALERGSAVGNCYIDSIIGDYS